jgi:hypothetical protein
MHRAAVIGCLLFITVFFVIRLAAMPPRLSLTAPLSSLTLLRPAGQPASKSGQLPILPDLSLDRVLAADHSWTASLSAEHLRTLLATGDIIPGRSVNFLATKYDNFLWPWAKVTATLKQADITFVNLEAPLIAGCQPTPVGMTFCGDPRNIAGFTAAGVDVANLANNHSTITARPELPVPKKFWRPTASSPPA